MNNAEIASFEFYLIIFLTILLIIFLRLLMVRFLKNRKIKFEQKSKEVFIHFLKIIINSLEGLEYHKNWLEKDKRVLDFLKKNYIVNARYRPSIATELLNLHRQLKGNAASRLSDVYYNLGLDQTGINYLKLGKANLQAKVIRDMTQMNVSSALPEIRRLLNSRDSTVRMEAAIALLRFEGVAALKELEEISGLTDWQKIKIVETAKRMGIDNLPNLKLALYSKNEFIIELALILIDYFDLDFDEDALAKIISKINYNQLLFSVPLIVKSKSILLIDELFRVFNLIQDEYVQSEILKNIKFFYEPKLIPYLLNIYYLDRFEDSVRLEAIRSAQKIAGQLDMELNISHIALNDEKMLNMYKHAIDPLI